MSRARRKKETMENQNPQESSPSTRKKKTTKKATVTHKHKSFAEAFAAAQEELQDPIKNSLNPHFKSEYVDLGTLMSSVRPVLAKHGLSICTKIEPYMDEVETVTEETHNGNKVRKVRTTKQMNGHMITAQIEFGHDQNITIRKSQLYVPPQKNVQAFASMHTYARRWLVGGLCGVAEARDDDGNAAVGDHQSRASQAVEQLRNARR